MLRNNPSRWIILSIALILFLSEHCYAGNTPSANTTQHAEFEFTNSLTIKINQYTVIQNHTDHPVSGTSERNHQFVIEPHRQFTLEYKQKSSLKLLLSVQDTSSQRFRWEFTHQGAESTLYVKITSIPSDDANIV